MIKVLLAVHIAAIVFWVVGCTQTGVKAHIAFASGDREKFVNFLRVANVRGPLLFRNCGVVVLLTGALLAQAGAYDVDPTSLAFAFLLLVASILLGAAIVGPSNTRLLDVASECGGPLYAHSVDFYSIVIGHYAKLGCLAAAALAVVVGTV